MRPSIECPCDGSHLVSTFHYDAPPEGETTFDLGSHAYERAYDRCSVCHHWFGSHDLDLSGLYGGDYSAATYGDRMGATFDRIVGLPAEISDNAGRRDRILEFAGRWFESRDDLTLLDVGSGLGVFPFAMRQAGWACTALDPDPIACRHIESRAGVTAICADFLEIEAADLGTFDAVTLNKVVEHVEEPCDMLRRAAQALGPRGLVYVEVPDGEAAAIVGKGREEFFIEHHHVFSNASLALMVARSGLASRRIDSIVEPSGKRTLVCFASREA